MKKKQDINWAWIPVFIWMGVIFYLSNQPATDSSELSNGIAEMCVAMIQSIFPIELTPASIHFFIRKGAHFFAYFTLGILTTYALRKNRRQKWIAFFICVIYAISDEIHQLFIPGRSGEIRDVLLDSTGALIGIILYVIIQKLLEWKK